MLAAPNEITLNGQYYSYRDHNDEVTDSLVTFRQYKCNITYDLAIYLAKTGWHAEEAEENDGSQPHLKCLKCKKTCALSVLEEYFKKKEPSAYYEENYIHNGNCPYLRISPTSGKIRDDTYKELWNKFTSRYNSFLSGRNYQQSSNIPIFTTAAATGFYVVCPTSKINKDGWSDDNLICIRCNNTYNYRRSTKTGADSLDKVIKQHNNSRCLPSPRKVNPAFNPEPSSAIYKSKDATSTEDQVNSQMRIRQSLNQQNYRDNQITIAINSLYGNNPDAFWIEGHIILVMDNTKLLISMGINPDSLTAFLKKNTGNTEKKILIEHFYNDFFNDQENKQVASESKRNFSPVNNNPAANSTLKQLPDQFGKMAISNKPESTADKHNYTGDLKVNHQEKGTPALQNQNEQASLLYSLNRGTECTICMERKSLWGLSSCPHPIVCSSDHCLSNLSKITTCPTCLTPTAGILKKYEKVTIL